MDAGITLLLGPPNSGKLGAVIEWWRELREREPLIVVPSQGDAAQLTLELVRRVGTVTGARPVVTFPGLVSGLLGRPPVLPSRAGRALLLRHLLGCSPLSELAPLAALPGTPGALEQLFRELDDSGLSRQKTSLGLARWRDAGGAGLAGDLATIYAAYTEALQSRGQADMGTWTLEASGLLGDWQRPVACYGFTSFAPVQRLLLERLAARVPLVLAFVHAEDRAVGRLTAAEIEGWLPKASLVSRLEPQSRVYSSPSLTYLAQTLAGQRAAAAGPPAPEGDLAGVRFLVASGRRNELELAGREIVRLLHAGVAPGDIAVLVRRLAPWASLARQVFGAYGIPFRLDHRIAWGQTGLGHAILLAMRGTLARDEVSLLAFLRSPYGGADPARVDRAEVRLRRRGHRGAAACDLLERWFSACLKPFRGLIEGEPGEPELSARLPILAEQLLQAAAGFGVLDPARLEEDARALGVLQRLSPELAGALDAGTSWASLLAVMHSSSVSLSREDEAGVVHVLSVARARPRRYSVVFLLGLVDGEFPGDEPSRGLLTQEQRRAANRAAGLPLLPAVADGLDEAFFALALTRPWQMLYLSTRDAEDEGGEVPTSPFWEQARAVLPGAPLLRRDLSEVVHPAHVSPSLQEYLRYCAAIGGLPPQRDHPDMLSGLPPWRRPAVLTLPGLRRELAARRVFSAGQLERYSRCPFTWFLSDLVGLEEMEQELDALRMGSLVHDVLARIYQGLESEGLLPLAQTGLARAEELLGQHLDRGLAALQVYGTHADRRLARQEVAARARLLLRFDAGSGSLLRPRWLERKFGSGGGVDVGGLRLSGRMDRVDASADEMKLFVIDYKNGSAVYGPSFAKDRALQVPLYMMALQAMHPGAQVIGGAYAALGSDTRGGIVSEQDAGLLGGWRPGTPVGEERFGAELEACLELAREAAAGIRGAAIPALPAAGCPRYCDFRPLCRGPLRQAEATVLLEEGFVPPTPRASSGTQLSLLGDQ